MHSWILTCLLLSLASTDTGDFDGIGDGTVTGGDDCPEGQVFDEDIDGCLDCTPGMFANMLTGKCQYCPYDYYSDKSGSTHCTPCPEGTSTMEIGSNSEYDCSAGAKCEIPETISSFYIGTEHNVIMNKGARVVSGSKLTFKCSQDNHVVSSTSYNYLNIFCTATTALELPTSCVMDPAVNMCDFPENAGKEGCGGSESDGSENSNGAHSIALSAAATIIATIIVLSL